MKIRAREAFEKGLTRYFSGEPCKYGHLVERMVSNGSCVECLRLRRVKNRKKIYERVKQWRLDNPGTRTEEARRYRKKHPEKVKANAKRYIERNLELARQRNREGKRRMRVTHPEREKLRLKRYYEREEIKKTQIAGRSRPEKCEICFTDEFRIVFDHCHVNGNFRGWICDRCNRVLGIVRDSPELLSKLIKYLEKSNGCGKAEEVT